MFLPIIKLILIVLIVFHSTEKAVTCSRVCTAYFSPRDCRSTERDRRYIVRTLSTMLLATKPKPSLQDCCVPAQALVQKYPFLADASDGKQSHVSNYMQ